MDDNKLLTTKQAASWLCIGVRTLQYLAASKDIRKVRIGSSVRFDPADLQAYIERCKLKAIEYDDKTHALMEILGWVDCRRLLPEVGKNVLTSESNRCAIARLLDNRKWEKDVDDTPYYDFPDPYEPEFWMHLPPAPNNLTK